MDSPFLALEELKSLVDPEDLHYLNGVALFRADSVDRVKYASFVKRAGKVIAIVNDVDEVISDLRGSCYSVRADSVMASDKDRVEVELAKLRKAVKFSRECKVLDAVFTEGLIILGERTAERDNESLLAHAKKPFSQSGTLSVDLARALVNLAKSRGSVYDPFVGLGGVLIEAAWEGLECYGSDVDLKVLKKAAVNLSSFGYSCELFQADATLRDLREVEAIATDPPYGRSVRVEAKDLIALYEGFFSVASEMLKKGGRLAFVTDSRLWFYDVLKGLGLRVLSISKVYEHKSLTRAVYVVEKA